MTYKGIEVLEARLKRDPGAAARQAWSAAVIDPGTGAVAVQKRSDVPSASRRLDWSLRSLQEKAAARAFLEARRGRAVPFWAPTWVADFELSQQLSAGSTSLRVRETGYTARMFPHDARRHLALITPDGTIHPRGVDAAVDNGDGTETLTISSGLPEDLPVRGGLASFLLLYRLADDSVEIEHHTQTYGELRADLVELPAEVPAP